MSVLGKNLQKHDVRYFSTNSDKKAAIVERFNRTLKTMMWKYFYSKGTYNWVDVLDELTNNYNHTKHSSITTTIPNTASQTKTKYGLRYTGYEANFTEDIFKVVKVFRGDPNMYEIESHDGEPIIGKFYEEELSAVDKKDDVYRVTKINGTKINGATFKDIKIIISKNGKMIYSTDKNK
ncbi:integrase core domain-containing [Paramuricea clavata]|uniref:Integrase core domain-containing n=1 Tax=Paramuricea clavata TaxID=317549 RepID=A0A6S7H172_PARCT|nr:integrase core domain-containing [Paramuricea clavata]